jgi:cyclophilin family peptidyl-prolyl cis-trans isomerase
MAKNSKYNTKKQKGTGSRRQLVSTSTDRGKRPSAAPGAKATGPLQGVPWWWIAGGAAAVIVVAGLIIWYTLGPGRRSSSAETSDLPVNPVDRADFYTAAPQMQIDPTRTYQATIVTGKGDIVVALDPVAAPQTVNNFVFLARQGFYDGLTFHRVEPGFVVQGGDPLGTGVGGPGYTVPAEIGLPHVEGAIAMARRGDQVNPERASSGSQFYIALESLPSLDGAYTVFGQVVEGMDVVRAIAIGDAIETVEIDEV